jgi:hypothetical protein
MPTRWSAAPSSIGRGKSGGNGKSICSGMPCSLWGLHSSPYHPSSTFKETHASPTSPKGPGPHNLQSSGHQEIVKSNHSSQARAGIQPSCFTARIWLRQAPTVLPQSSCNSATSSVPKGDGASYCLADFIGTYSVAQRTIPRALRDFSSPMALTQIRKRLSPAEV